MRWREEGKSLHKEFAPLAQSIAAVDHIEGNGQILFWGWKNSILLLCLKVLFDV